MPVAVRLLFSLVALLIILGGTAVAVTWGLSRLEPGGFTGESWDQPLDGATLVSAQVRVDTGRVELGPTLPAGPPLSPGTAMMAESLTPRTAPATVTRYPVDANTAQIDFRTTTTTIPATVLRWLREPDATEWDIALTDDIPVSMVIEILRGSARVDLTGMTLRDLLIQVGVGSADIVVGHSSGTGQIRVGVGDATVRVPDDVAVRIDVGQSSPVVGNGFGWDGSGYVNAAWRDRTDPSSGLSLVVESGAGTVNIVSLQHPGAEPDDTFVGSPNWTGERGFLPSPCRIGATPADAAGPALTASRRIGDGMVRTTARRGRRPDAGHGQSGPDRKAPA